tara:strand:- start:707 stop:997 length:291 start_codon:yes stop_codon:yes gene_type:complete
MNKEAEINKELIKVLKEKIQLLEEQKANNQDIINAQKEQLILSGVVSSKRFDKNDLLRAYQAGSLENLNKTIVPTSMEDLKELLEYAEKWYKRYTE